MVDNFDDDYFKHTAMTFGEHLEELRMSLFKAVLALAVGFGVGLWFGDWIVRRIQDPIVSALTDFYLENAVTRFKERIDEQEKRGAKFPPGFHDSAQIEALLRESQLLPEEVYLDPNAAIKELKQIYPEKFKDIEVAEEPNQLIKRDSMVRLFLWHAFEDDNRLRVQAMSAQEGFMIWMKAAFLAGAVISSPLVFYFVWSFIAAGLYPHEKKYINYFLPFSVVLFLMGASLAFFFVFKPVLTFFFSFNRSLGIDPDPRISEWLSFVLMMPLGFGVAFQLPLVMLFLARIGILSVEIYLSKWRIAVLIMSIASMVLSPGGDPYSMMMMLIPLIFLYFGGIALCKYLPSNRNPYADELETTN